MILGCGHQKGQIDLVYRKMERKEKLQVGKDLLVEHKRKVQNLEEKN
jgi:hypothetical protein